ncbi:MAG: SH3 domain-containing protein, partial [Myxococcota bacterium]|nr:SH3 domain-containing protein [Myxococcota bacterium]
PSETAPDSVVDGVPALARAVEKGASDEAANFAPANGAETQDGALVEDEYETIIVDEPEMDEPAMDELMGENSAPDEVVARKLADADTSSLGGADKATDAVATARMGNGTDENLGEGAEDFAGRPTTLAEAERGYLVTAETVKDVAVEGPVAIDPEDSPTADTTTDLGSEDGIDALVDDFYVKTNAYLVLRKWASARSKKVWVIPKNTVVSVIGRRDDKRWIKVRYQHREGWIAWVKNRVTPEGQPFNIDDLEIVAR